MSSPLVTGPIAPISQHNSHGHPPAPRDADADGVVVRALARHRPLIVVCAIVLAGLGAGFGALRAGTYTASATLQVGQVNPNSPGFFGFVQSATDLATAFSRSITAESVLDTVHEQLGLGPNQAVDRLSAEPIPNSPIFRVIATGPNPTSAIRLANVAGNAVVAYVTKANTTDPEGDGLLASYHAASLRLAKVTAETGRAAAAYAAHPSVTTFAALLGARAQQAAEKLRTQAIAANYQESARNTTTTDLVSLLAGAATATSDHSSKIELYAFTGLLAGFVIGCAGAIVLDRRKLRVAP
jgi:uncharacterized protein involved in exopolysaccharide biosynthesis